MQSETEFLNIGTGFLDTFRYKKAIDYFTKAIEINPKNSQIFELRGIAWFRIFNIDQALNDTSKAIELDEENHAAWYNKGEILKFKNEYEAAEACYNQANKMYAGSFFYLTGLIQTCYSQKKYNETIEYCNQILNELTTDDIALSYRGLAYAKQLNYTLAIRDYLKLVETRKPDATNYCNLGHWYSKIGELKKAYNNLSVSLQLNPTHPYA